MGITKTKLGEYLTKAGYSSEEEDYGFIFKHKNLTFYILWDDEDDQYIRLMLPNIYNVDDNNRIKAIKAANEVNIEWKVIKALVFSENVWVAAEQLIDKDPNLADMIPRTLQILMSGRESFYEHLKSV